VTLANRESELAQRPTEPFEEHCASRLIISQHPHAALAIRETQDRDLVPGSAPSAGTSSFSTAGVPSASAASATKASVASS